MIDPNDYWVNNPLITPVNKALMYDNAIFNAAENEKERIIKLLEADGLNCDCDWCQINGDVPSQHHWRILALIKGETNG